MKKDFTYDIKRTRFVIKEALASLPGDKIAKAIGEGKLPFSAFQELIYRMSKEGQHQDFTYAPSWTEPGTTYVFDNYDDAMDIDAEDGVYFNHNILTDNEKEALRKFKYFVVFKNAFSDVAHIFGFKSFKDMIDGFADEEEGASMLGFLLDEDEDVFKYDGKEIFTRTFDDTQFMLVIFAHKLLDYIKAGNIKSINGKDWLKSIGVDVETLG